MPEQLFLFIQLEFPWALGPADGRYLLRARPDSEPERVVVLGTLGAARASTVRRVSVRRQRRARTEATPEPNPVSTARATIVDPIPLSAERQAHAWLADLDAERESLAAAAVLNRVLYAHRVASADPYVHEVSPGQALVIRAGWGEGEQVADGRWLYARELPFPTPRKQRRVAALRPMERLAELLGARGATLRCEELALRARLDLDHERLALAAIQLDSAYAVAIGELRVEHRQDLAIRIAELEQLRAEVTLQAQAAIRDATGTDATASAPDAHDSTHPAGSADTGATGTSEAPTKPEDDVPTELDEEVVGHALKRLEAALRARTATGFSLK
jgi:hypothetical protein